MALSLRARVLIGAVLWTIGLFAVAGVVVTSLVLRLPLAPRVFHGLFVHGLGIAAVAVACMLGGLWQVRKGLSPLHELRARLAAVREGRAPRVEGTYAAEVQPLVNDLNALLEHRERTVGRALAKAGDLAHGLKTPLAVLAQDAAEIDAAGHADLAAAISHQVERMRRQVDFHLAHARAAASGAAPGARCPIAASAEGLARTLQRIHASRRVTIDVDIPAALSFRGERADLDEMLGNLVDNACKWAKSRVEISARDAGGRVAITVDDDGAGLPEAMRDVVLQRGVRADEAAPGSGFGLAIVRDLAELYGGAVTLEQAPIGGLRARLELPA